MDSPTQLSMESTFTLHQPSCSISSTGLSRIHFVDGSTSDMDSFTSPDRWESTFSLHHFQSWRYFLHSSNLWMKAWTDLIETQLRWCWSFKLLWSRALTSRFAKERLPAQWRSFTWASTAFPARTRKLDNCMVLGWKVCRSTTLRTIFFCCNN